MIKRRTGNTYNNNYFSNLCTYYKVNDDAWCWKVNIEKLNPQEEKDHVCISRFVIFKDEIENLLNSVFGIFIFHYCFCLAINGLTYGFISILLISKLSHCRDHPDTIKHRFINVSIITVIIPIILFFFGTTSDAESVSNLICGKTMS